MGRGTGATAASTAFPGSVTTGFWKEPTTRPIRRENQHRTMAYVELHARSAFSFLRGASSPEQLARQCAEAGLPAWRSATATACTARRGSSPPPASTAFAPIVGAELTMEDDTVLPVLVETARATGTCADSSRGPSCAAPRPNTPCAGTNWRSLPKGLVCLTGDEEGPLFRALALRRSGRRARGAAPPARHLRGPAPVRGSAAPPLARSRIAS